MKSFKKFLDEAGRCWTGYKPVKGKKPFSPGSCEEVSEDVVNEDGAAAGAGGGMNVAAIAGTGDSRLPASQREPGVSKKHNPIIQKLARRTLPKV